MTFTFHAVTMSNFVGFLRCLQILASLLSLNVCVLNCMLWISFCYEKNTMVLLFVTKRVISGHKYGKGYTSFAMYLFIRRLTKNL